MVQAWQVTLQQSLQNFTCIYAEMRSAQAPITEIRDWAWYLSGCDARNRPHTAPPRFPR